MEDKIYGLIDKMYAEMQEMKANMATKDDIKNMATKDDIKNMATKDDIKNMATKDDIKNMATKDDIKNMATKDDIKNMATKDDIKNMATKDDINSMDFRISNIEQTMATKDDIKELKGDIQNLENKIENLLSEQQKDILSILKLTYNQIDDKLDKINSEIEFLNHKEKLNEKEIFMLKKNI